MVKKVFDVKSVGFIVRKYSSIAFFDVYEIAQFDTSTITNIVY